MNREVHVRICESVGGKFPCATRRVPRAHCIYKVCVTAQEMRVGPSEPAYRSRLQTTSSCMGKEPLWLSLIHI